LKKKTKGDSKKLMDKSPDRKFYLLMKLMYFSAQIS